MIPDDIPQEWNMVQPNHFTVGASGEPGQREFFFQAINESNRVDVKCEKQQAVALSEHLTRLLADLPEPAGEAPADTAEPVEAYLPAYPTFVVGSISIGVDRNTDRIVVLFDELVVSVDDEDDDEEVLVPLTPKRLMVHLSREQVLGFAAQTAKLASTGRPLCRLCNMPIDPEGHACPRLN